MNKYQFIVTMIASLGGLLRGFNGVNRSSALYMDSFRIYMKLFTWDGSFNSLYTSSIQDNDTESTSGIRSLIKTNDKDFIEESISLLFNLGVFLGLILASYSGGRLGRKNALWISGIIYMIGSLVQALTLRHYLIFALGGLIVGIGLGICDVVCPVYLAEISSEKNRGVLIGCFDLMASIGTILSSIINSIVWYKTDYKPKDLGTKRKSVDEPIQNIGWRSMLLIQAFLGLIYALLIYYIPKSPRWLCSMDKDQEALNVIAKFHYSNTDDSNVQEKFEKIHQDVLVNRTMGRFTFSELFSPLVRRRTFNTIILQFLQQWMGLNNVLYYQAILFNEINNNGIFMNLILPNMNYLIMIIGIIVSLLLIDRLGRKSLLFFGSLFMFFLHMLTFVFSYYTKTVKFQRLSVVSIFLYIFAYSCTWNIVPWVYQGEVFPLRVRIKGAALGTVSNYLSSYIINTIGIFLSESWGGKIYLLFAAYSFISLIFVVVFSNEPKGVELEEMDNQLAGRAYSKKLRKSNQMEFA